MCPMNEQKPSKGSSRLVRLSRQRFLLSFTKPDKSIFLGLRLFQFLVFLPFYSYSHESFNDQISSEKCILGRFRHANG